jgi:GT2 family glycosyltransferase
MNKSPRVSVIISVHDHDCLGKNLAALAHQGLPPSEFEVFVIDAEHAVDSESIVKQALSAEAKGLRLDYYNMPRSGRAAAWNKGINEASADLILLLSDDFVVTPGFLEAHLNAHEQDPREEFVALGPGIFPPDWEFTPFMHWMEKSGKLFGASFYDDQLPPDFFYGANVSLKKNFLIRAGLFDESFPYDAWEDYELGQRLLAWGMVVKYVPDAVAYHYHSYTLDDRCKAMMKAGESAAIYDKKYPARHPWHENTRLPVWLYAVCARIYLYMYRIFHRHKHLQRYWSHSLTHAFVAAYRNKKEVLTASEH